MPAALALVVASGLSLADTVTFQAGMGEFGTTLDTTLAARASIDPTDPWLFVDTSDGDHGNAEVRTLIWFPDIVGPSEGQIRQGSQIHAATLTLQVDNPGGELGIHEVLESWTLDEVSWAQRSSGEDWTAEGAGSPSSAEKALVTLENTTVGTLELSARIAVREWVRDPSLNHGLVLIALSSDGTDIFSSDAEDPAQRPMLTVEYTPSEGDTGLAIDSGDSSDPDDTHDSGAAGDTASQMGFGNAPQAGEKEGCGCAAGRGVAGGWVLALALLAGTRRRKVDPSG